jgi:hypothetical protein
MSGGSHDYTCYKVQNECAGEMEDEQINLLLDDFVEVLHDLEWWKSWDSTEEQYRETVARFKKKWLKDGAPK